MRLTVVGSSGSFPGPDAPASCYLLEHDDHRILLDMGNGSLGALQRHTDIYAIDAVIISHLHVDHFIDLCSYYVALRYRPGVPAARVPVWGPEGTAVRLKRAYGLSDTSGMAAEFDVRALRRSFSVGPFEITTAVMCHPVVSRAIRVSAGGRTITYSGDTGPTDRLVQLARGSDLALFEASFRTGDDNPADLHLTGEQAARHALEAGAQRLVLTHLVPWYDPQEILAEAAPVFPEAQLARSGLVIDV